jgi:tRNA-dihydrouridine synthase B
MDSVLFPSPAPSFWIGTVPIYGDAILAPMDGFSDWPYRSICRRLGSAMSFTEFMRAEFVVQALKHVAPRLSFQEDERPVAFQIYGDEPDEILTAALLLQEKQPDIIDINMGCPVRSIAYAGAGVGLMRTPLKIARIFRRLSAALDVPVTGKIRLGWENCRNYSLVARIIAENGGAAITVHGRTREQGYGGRADWDAIAEVRNSVSIPVIGNGDVCSVQDIERMKGYTGCPAVMIGRGAVGNPWIFARRARESIPPAEVRDMMRLHLQRNMEFYGPRKGYGLFRKHANRYLSLQRLPRQQRIQLLTQENAADFVALLDETFAALESCIGV